MIVNISRVRGVSRYLGWKNEWTMLQGRSAATSIGDRNWPARPLVSQSRGARSKADRGANRWTRPNWISRTSRAAIRHSSVQFGRESCHSLSATASFIFVWPAVTPSSRRRTPEILSAEWCCVDTYLEQNGNEIDQFCGTALVGDGK